MSTRKQEKEERERELLSEWHQLEFTPKKFSLLIINTTFSISKPNIFWYNESWYL